MALRCWRHGGGLLLHVVCLLLFVIPQPQVGICALCTIPLLNGLLGASSCEWRVWEDHWKRTLSLVLIWQILSDHVGCAAGESTSNGQIMYSATELLGLRHSRVTPSAGLLKDVPRELFLHPDPGFRRRRKIRKRGRRGGIRQRVRRATKLPLPPMILSNTRSLKNKLDELRQQVGTCYEFRESGLLAFTETWFGDDVPENFVHLEGFSHVRLDRNANSGKTKGGGVCIYIRDSWCQNFAIREEICNPDLELLCVTLRPHFLPREFTNIFVCIVYVPPSANAGRAANQIAECVHRLLQVKPDAPMMILGDFNHCCLTKVLPGFYQYIKCSTRNNNILDKCYGNIKNAYIAKARAPLGNSDHNVIHLLPSYRSVFKSCKPEIQTVKVWTSDKKEELKGCFLCTDWDIFFEDADIDSATESITDYISFCVDSIIPQVTVKRYPNNKPYITEGIKECLRRKRAAFKSGDSSGVRAAQKDLNIQLRVARSRYKEKAEQHLSASNTKKLWNSIRQMTNMDTKKKPLTAQNELLRANELNDFYMRFNTDNVSNCTAVLNNVRCEMNKDRILIDPHAVKKVFKTMHTNKATGPDNLSAFLLKTFAEELSPVWHKLFQLSVDCHTVPLLWKKSVIIPVPKKVSPRENNDYRPVTLTSNVFKCFERLMLEKLHAEVEPSLDKYQFAYAKKRSTSDAIVTLMHLILKHLECPATYARLLFIDFSSAFNLIQPHILLKKFTQEKVNPFLIHWYHSFLSDRPQQVKFNSVLSDTTVCSTGAPQGSVSSPFLFTFYTNDCVSSEPNQFILKFSDDTVLLSLLTKNSCPNTHSAAAENLVAWCDRHKLQINTKKTVEMVIDPRSAGDHGPLTIHGQRIEQVSSFKYLGVNIDSDLSWRTQVTSVCTSIHQRLHFLRRLRLFGVCKNIMLIFYRAAIESVLRYGITCWFGNLTIKSKSQISSLVKTAGKIMGTPVPLNPQDLFEQATRRQTRNILSDLTHVLYPEYQLMNSGRRYRVPLCSHKRYKCSFVPLSVKYLNDQK